MPVFFELFVGSRCFLLRPPSSKATTHGPIMGKIGAKYRHAGDVADEEEFGRDEDDDSEMDEFPEAPEALGREAADVAKP